MMHTLKKARSEILMESGICQDLEKNENWTGRLENYTWHQTVGSWDVGGSVCWIFVALLVNGVIVILEERLQVLRKETAEMGTE